MISGMKRKLIDALGGNNAAGKDFGVRRASMGTGALDRLLLDRIRSEGDGQSSMGDPGGYYGTSTAVHAAVRVLGEAVSRPRLVVWQIDGASRTRVGPHHRLQRLLDQPAPSWDTGALLREIEGSLALWGSAYVALRHDDGFVDEMLPLHAGSVRVVVEKGRKVAVFVHDDGDIREAYLPDEVLWFRRYNPNSWYGGYSSLVPAQVGVEMGDEALRYNRRFYLNSAMPSDVVITSERGSPEEIERVLEAWEARVYEPTLAHRPFVLYGGIDMKRLGSSQSDMEFIGALEWSVEEVSRSYGVPKVFLSEYEDATLSNIAAMEQFLWRNTIIPELRFLEDGLNRGLIGGYETAGENLEIGFDLSDIEAVQESQSEKAERLGSLVQSGIMTVEEARAELGL